MNCEPHRMPASVTTPPALHTLTCNVGAKNIRAAEGADGSTFDAVFIVAGKTLNGEYFPASTLQAATEKFVGAKMYVNHPRLEADMRTRDLRDLAGVIESVQFVENELRGTIRVSETVGWLRTLVKEGIAGDLSINVMAMLEWKDDMIHVVEIARVLSVDFVTEGAAQGRILEALASHPSPVTPSTPTPSSHMDLSTLTLAQLQASRPDLVTEAATTSKEATTLTEENKALAAKVAEYEAAAAATAHATLVQEALDASGIDAKLHDTLRLAVSKLDARDAMDAMLAGIKESLASVVPASKGNAAAEDAADAKTSVITEAIADTFGVVAEEDEA